MLKKWSELDQKLAWSFLTRVEATGNFYNGNDLNNIVIVKVNDDRALSMVFGKADNDMGVSSF